MERQDEITRLVHVLRRMAETVEAGAGEAETAAFNVAQYNRVLARLTALDAAVGSVFEPLPDDSPPAVVSMACRQLAAYFADETRRSHHHGRDYGPPFDPDSFKKFWQQSARDIEDLGAFIRKNLETWSRQRTPGTPDASAEKGADADDRET